MYGTVARFKVLPGKEAELTRLMESREASGIPGFVANAIYNADAGDGEYWMAVIFESKEAYRANAESPEQDANFRQLRALLAADPEWHDGEVIRRVVA